MCGLVGLVGESDRSVAIAAVERMSQSVSRRGPDDNGIWVAESVAFGHRRLAIFDLSTAGHQPMISHDGQIAIVFNGAIYNFPELRRELEAQGSRFTSRTDTEVLIEGYRVWGIDALAERIRGMYAFAIWDSNSHEAILVRDRLGVKPLYYSIFEGKLAFASTARALRDGGFARELDASAVADFLEYGYVREEHCIYASVRKLPAAHILRWHAGKTKQHRYWSVPLESPVCSISFEDAVEETQRLFVAAVERRLFADKPVRALLSGGIDSSLVCWAVGQLGGDVTAFTVGTPGDPWDESADAAITARELGVQHRTIEAEHDASFSVHELVEAFGEPFACASALGMLGLSKAVREDASVLLTGDGGDDVFLGYPEHLHLLWAQRAAKLLPALATPLWRRARSIMPEQGALRRARHFADYATGGLAAYAQAHEGLPDFRRDGMLGRRLHEVEVDGRRTEWSHQSAKRILSDVLHRDNDGRFVSEYLTKVDGACMHWAVEARSPFLDTDLWEFAALLPYSTRLHGGKLKAILRELARRHLGPRVSRGAKRGFGVPVQKWVAGRWAGDVEAAFTDSLAHSEGWLNAASVLKRLRQSREFGEAPKRIWYAYVLEQWLRRERASL